MDVMIEPCKLTGTLPAISSKSDVHRLLICAALSDKPTNIYLSGSMTAARLSNDIKATISCLNALGAHIRASASNKYLTVSPIVTVPEFPILDCKESGSTLRFLLPVAAALRTDATFVGAESLASRPIGELLDTLKEGGARFDNDKIPLTVHGGLYAGDYDITGKVSSQYITGLMFALTSILGRSRIYLTTELESSPYIDVTISAMERFGVKIQDIGNGYLIPSRKFFISPEKITADTDWSNASYFLLAAALGQDVKVAGLNNGSPQGDKLIAPILTQMAQVEPVNNMYFSTPNFLNVSLEKCPDLAPTLAVAAVYTPTGAKFVDVHRLRLKESDRIQSICQMINDLGGKATIGDDTLIVFPKKLTGGIVRSYNDHRIVMAATIASTMCPQPVTILDAQAVNKSYPTFFEDFKLLGGKVHVI